MEVLDRDYAAATLAEIVRKASDAELAEGIYWYPHDRLRAGSRAGRFVLDVAREYSLPYRKVAAVLVFGNVNNTWAGSLTFTHRVCSAYARGGRRPRAGLQIPVKRAWEVLKGTRTAEEILRPNPRKTRGWKSWNFYLNLCGDQEAVTVDRWACRVAGIDEAVLGRRGGYAAVADCYRIAAENIGLTPAETQAITWVAVRGRAH